MPVSRPTRVSRATKRWGGVIGRTQETNLDEEGIVTITGEDAMLASDGCRLLTIEAAADFLAISRSAVYQLLDRGEVASIHIGRSRRIALAELRRFVANSGHRSMPVAS
jgi:excisionase family DNA binding protein